jgi:hypothetical protein
MTAETPAIDLGSAPIKRRKRPRKAIDFRTRNGRRVKQLTGIYSSALGPGLSDVQRQDVARAARLMAISEDAQLRRLRGESVDLDELVRCDSTGRRAVRDLGLRPPHELEAARTFREYMKQKYGTEGTDEDDE